MILIKNSKILTMTGKFYENGYVLIDQGKIIEAGEGELYKDNGEFIKKNGEGKDIKVLDGKGGYCLPGFIDAHCHVGMWEDSTGFEGADGNEATDPVTPHLRAIDGVYHLDRSFKEARESGVTAVVTGPGSANVIGGQFIALKTCGKRIEDMVIKEPVALKVAFGENPKNVYNNKKQMPSTRMATAAILRENLLKAKQYKEKKGEEKGVDFDLKMETLIKVLDREIPVKAHAHRSDDILTAIRIAKEFNLRMTIEHCTEGHLIADIIKEEGYSAIVGPFLSDRSKIELKNLSVKAPGILSNKGIDIAIMTDHPVIPIQNLWLCAAIATREGMDSYEALKAITINAARICGIDDVVGSIEPGKDGDVVVFDGHPLNLFTKVCYTIINGEVVYFDKDLNEK